MTIERARSEQSRQASRDLDLAAKRRLEADRQLSMNDRLAALHELCKQIAAIEGAAKRR